MSKRDYDCIVGVTLGHKRALLAALERFHPVVLAQLAHRLKDFPAARRAVDDIVRELFRALLAGTIGPRGFHAELVGRVAAAAEMTNAAGAVESEPLHSMHSAAKLVRRRAASRAIRELPLNQFTALVLHYHAGWSAAEMTGIVADTDSEVEEALGAAHAAVAQAAQSGE